mgnify:CR=1 FL=1
MSDLVSLDDHKTAATVADLIAWFESIFTCLVGPTRAWVDIPVSPGKTHKWIFQTYMVKTSTTPDAEQRLCRAMQDEFSQLEMTPAWETILIWRLPQKIEIKQETIPIYGELLATDEGVLYGLQQIPTGADVIKSHQDGNWYRLEGYDHFTTIRTRLVIPALNFINVPIFGLKAEGAEVVRI